MSLLVENQFLPGEYGLEISVNHTKPNFEGHLWFPLSANPHFSGPESEFKMTLNGHNLVILSAEVDGKALDVSTNPKEQLIHLKGKEAIKEIGPDSVVTIMYLGKINQLKRGEQSRGVFKVGDSDVITTQTQPIFAREVYPVIDDLNWKVPIKFSVTTAKEFEVIANTELESTESCDETRAKYGFVKTPPMLASNFCFTIGPLSRVQDQCGDISISVYCSAVKASDAKTSIILATIKQILPIMEAELGPYPLKKLDVVGVPYLLEGAMENWGAISVMESYLYNSNTLQLHQLVCHELIHQWIGNMVSFNTWKHLWLNESMATYLGNYFVTKINPQYNMAEDLMSLNSKLLTLKELNIQKFMNKLVLDNKLTVDYLFNHLVYEKGIIILRMMVALVGEPDDLTNFLAGIKGFLDQKRFSTVNANELWQHLSLVYEVDLLSFVNIWVRYDKYPVLQVNVDLKVTIHQNQSQIYTFPLVIKTATKDLKVVITNKTTELELSELSDLLVLNKNKIALARLEVSKKLLLLVEVSKLNKLDCQNYLIDYPTGGFNKKVLERLQLL